MLVSSFNLSESFNYTLYLFYKKRFKSEINSFCIWTLVTLVALVDLKMKRTQWVSKREQREEINLWAFIVI